MPYCTRFQALFLLRALEVNDVNAALSAWSLGHVGLRPSLTSVDFRLQTRPWAGRTRTLGCTNITAGSFSSTVLARSTTERSDELFISYVPLVFLLLRFLLISQSPTHLPALFRSHPRYLARALSPAPRSKRMGLITPQITLDTMPICTQGDAASIRRSSV